MELILATQDFISGCARAAFSSELALYSHNPKATHPRLLQLEQRQHQIVRFVCKSLYVRITEQGESYSAVRCRKKVKKTFIMIKMSP